MKNSLNTRYIGCAKNWMDFWKVIIHNQKFYTFFDDEDAQQLVTEIQSILARIDANYDLYNTKVKQYPFKIPQSFKDMWLSGTIDIFETIFNYFEGYRDEFIATESDRYFKLFLNPEYVKNFNFFLQQRNFLNPTHGFDNYIFESMLEMQDRQSSSEVDAYKENFYQYPPDEYVNPIALSTQSMMDMFLLAEGSIEVDGGALFILADEPFLDKEFEVGVFSYSEASWIRYQTIPEPFLYTLAYIAFEREVHSVDDLLNAHSAFHLLYR